MYIIKLQASSLCGGSRGAGKRCLECGSLRVFYYPCKLYCSALWAAGYVLTLLGMHLDYFIIIQRSDGTCRRWSTQLTGGTRITNGMCDSCMNTPLPEHPRSFWCLKTRSKNWNHQRNVCRLKIWIRNWNHPMECKTIDDMELESPIECLAFEDTELESAMECLTFQVKFMHMIQ